MSLRLRLTLLYSALLGGLLLLMGTLIYGIVNAILLAQVDETLATTSNQIADRMRVNPSNYVDVRSLAYFIPNENVIFQFWNARGDLVMARPGGQPPPLDLDGINHYGIEIKTISNLTERLRVLSVPVVSKNGFVGTLQVGESMALIDYIQQVLGIVLAVVALLGCLLSGALVWVMTGRALAPLQAVIRVATRLTRADDLQRRIPFVGRQNDEVGVLINSFNQTLERLEQLFNAQRRFMADISHELRTPLTVIKGNVGLMQRIGSTDTESLESINVEVDRLTRMVGDLLFLAQAETGNLQMISTPVELDSVLTDVFPQMKLMAGDRVELRLAELEQVQVLGDRDRLKQVMLNLIGNALKYTPQGGMVAISLRKYGGRVQFIVTDTGPGIPSADLPHIFERFYRAEKSRKRDSTGGFGLGLSIAYWIVRHHNGQIDVTSREGRGTTFMVWLPLLEEKQAEA